MSLEKKTKKELIEIINNQYHLAAAVEVKDSEISNLINEKQKAKETEKELRSKVFRLEKELKELELQNQAKENEISNLANKNTKAKEMENELRNQIVKLETELNKLRLEIKYKDDAIANLMNEKENSKGMNWEKNYKVLEKRYNTIVGFLQNAMNDWQQHLQQVKITNDVYSRLYDDIATKIINLNNERNGE